MNSRVEKGDDQMFDFFAMMGNYEDRKVARFEDGTCTVDTAAVTDSAKPYETGICHPAYNEGAWVIVELYDTKEGAVAGHDRWVKTMTAKELPAELTDVSTATTAVLLDGAASAVGEAWRVKSAKEGA